MDAGTVQKINGEWWAQFAPGGLDKFGGVLAIGSGRTQDHAIKNAMDNAEIDFGWHGAVRFS